MTVVVKDSAINAESSDKRIDNENLSPPCPVIQSSSSAARRLDHAAKAFFVDYVFDACGFPYRHWRLIVWWTMTWVGGSSGFTSFLWIGPDTASLHPLVNIGTNVTRRRIKHRD